jgi:cytochrome c peroxidase
MVYVWIISCTPAPHLAFKLSPYFADSLPYPAHNPFSADGIALGELLFHETALSGNNEISCATCHSPDLHFTDGFALTNKGLRKKKLSRNTPTLFNLAWANKGLFWDGGAQNLESLVFAPLKHADEMGQDLKLLPQELMQKGNYKTLFFNAFDQDTITNAFIARALAQYMRTLTSSNSKYDAVVQKKAQFSDLEHKGLEIFTQSCISCHPPPFFTDFDFHLVSKFSEAKSIEKMIENEMEKGRFRITADSADIGKFKTPTLRNLALTAPYFHDGHCTTPEMAIREHKVLAQLPNDNEIILLIHFLNTLNEQRVK